MRLSPETFNMVGTYGNILRSRAFLACITIIQFYLGWLN